MADISKINNANLNNTLSLGGASIIKIVKINGVQLSAGGAPVHRMFIPNEFDGPLGAEWIEDPTNTGSFAAVGGHLVITQTDDEFVNIYQIFEDASFDIWTKINVSNTSLSGVPNRYNIGGISMFGTPYDEWSYPGASMYLQYNFGEADYYSLAIYAAEDVDNDFIEETYVPGGFDTDNSEVYFRIKYEVGDKLRLYWSQGGEWSEIDTGLEMVPTSEKFVVLSGMSNDSPVDNTASFDFIRKHNEIPF